MIISVKVIPNSRENKWVEDDSGQLRIKIASKPVDGKANKELVLFLAEHFDVPKSSIRIIHGEKSNYKRIEIVGR
ncbi:MAG: hypothetical protein A3H98_13480 [Bacteroidetes bacterium RIFCSPLOWO2_02_FULL_36_8]|nr:MAG: hypothetical protein A3H98_13480 [Bacteroidetes bacterium RIFCSPLOWO2_02_FULL_36_8]OFY71768.1 MAG: hypothetical protein A3G23_13700 [Bacteroidetes bacterium RIFCSPLOWO2_12_FULL_37_12]